MGIWDEEEEDGILIPVDQLEPDTLRGVIEEFVTRDGTNLADADRKIEQVTGQLKRGYAEIWFDRTSGTCTVRPTQR